MIIHTGNFLNITIRIQLFILGELMPEDVIHDTEQFSWIDRQQFLFEKTV